MRYALIITIISLFFVSCKKDTARPQLTYTSANTGVLNSGQVIEFTLHFTDPTGGADSLFVQQVVPNCPASGFNDSIALPDYNAFKNDYGDILVHYSYNSVGNYPLIKGPQCAENDTSYFRFVLKDNMGDRSDTVRSGTIIVVF